MDRIDFEILAVLSHNARLSNKMLAERVGLAESTCLQRVRRLVESRVLRGFHADVDHKAIGLGVQAVVAIELSRPSAGAYATVRDHLMQRREVVSIYRVTGRHDIVAIVVVPDVDRLQELVGEYIPCRDEVRHVETSLIFEHVHTHALPHAQRTTPPRPPSSSATERNARLSNP